MSKSSVQRDTSPDLSLIVRVSRAVVFVFLAEAVERDAESGIGAGLHAVVLCPGLAVQE